MYKRYLFIFICMFLSDCSGIIKASNVNQAETNKVDELDQNMNRILNLMDQKIPTLFLILNELDTKITKNLEWNRNCQADASQKIKYLEENFNRKLDMLGNNVSKVLVENNDFKSKALNKIEDSINEKFNSYNKILTPKFEEILNIKLDDFAKNISKEFKSNINCYKNATKEVDDGKENNYNGTSMKNIPEENKLPCKEESLSSDHRETDHYSVDNESLNHVTVKRDSAGLLTYFEVHVAIQADDYVGIQLRDKDHSRICAIDVGLDSNQYTMLWYAGTHVLPTHTPDILSSTQLRAFYIIVDNGTLKFGKEGDSPLISHYDADLRSLEYFNYWYSGETTSQFRYDCPRVPESS